MFDKNHIALAGIAALAITSDIRTKIEAHKAAKLYLAAAHAYEAQIKQHEAQVKYLCHLMDEHEIPVNEFDLIALNFHIEQ